MDLLKKINKYFKYAPCDDAKVNELLGKIASSSNSPVVFKKDAFYDESKSVAYCYKKYDTYFVHDCEFMDESTVNYSRMHELSHVMLGHLDINTETIHKTFENTVLPHLPNIRKRFGADIPNDKIIDYLYIQMSNIAQDMEINSTVYGSTDNWKNAEAAIQKAFIQGLLENGKDDLALQYFNSVKAHDGKFELCHPMNKKWPNGLSWINYIILLAKDEDAMNKALDDAQDKMENGGDSEEQKDQNNKNDQNDDSDENQNSKDNNQNDSSKDKKQPSDKGDNTGDDKGNGGSQPQQNKPSNGGKNRSQITLEQVEGSITDEIAKTGNAALSSENRGSNAMEQMLGKQAGKGTETSGEIILCKDSDEDLVKFIKKTFVLTKTSIKSDQLYYTNRNRYGASAPIIPRRTADEQYVPTTCNFLVDISGSMDRERILKNISTIKEVFSDSLDAKNSHVVLCNENVVDDFTLDKIPEVIRHGGGTDLSEGLAYIGRNHYMKKDTATLFILSDFEDYTVRYWQDIIDGFKGNVCGILQDGERNVKLTKFDKRNILKSVTEFQNA